MQFMGTFYANSIVDDAGSLLPGADEKVDNEHE
jgi:hypothetical protein